MPRKKANDQDQVLAHPIIIRVIKTVFERLDKKRKESDCGTIGEVARKILPDKQIRTELARIALIQIHLKTLVKFEEMTTEIDLFETAAAEYDGVILQLLSLIRRRVIRNFNY